MILFPQISSKCIELNKITSFKFISCSTSYVKSEILHWFNHLGKFVIALTPCSHCSKGNWSTISAESLLIVDCVTPISLRVLISRLAEIAQKMSYGKLSSCQICLI